MSEPSEKARKLASRVFGMCLASDRADATGDAARLIQDALDKARQDGLEWGKDAGRLLAQEAIDAESEVERLQTKTRRMQEVADEFCRERDEARAEVEQCKRALSIFRTSGAVGLLERAERAEAEVERLREALRETTDLMGTSNDSLIGRLRAAQAEVARVRALHREVVIWEMDDTSGTWVYRDDEKVVLGRICAECSDPEVVESVEDCEYVDDGSGAPWPCATRAALEDTEQGD